MTLTAQQRRVIETIRTLTRDRGYPPSQREVSDRMGLKSVSTIHAHIKNLKAMGVVQHDPDVARSLRVVTEQQTLGDN